MDRRMFHREPISINGELSWITKGRLGRKERQHSYVRTSNLSLDGTRVDLNGHFPFAIDAVARLQLGIYCCDVRILEVIHSGERTSLRLCFMAPSTEFVSVVEQHLPVITPGRDAFEGKWI